MQFKGGRGAATAYGILSWTYITIALNYLTIDSVIPFIFFLYFLLAIYWVTRSANFTAFAGLPSLIPLVFWYAGVNAYTIFIGSFYWEKTGSSNRFQTNALRSDEIRFEKEICGKTISFSF